jgi:hypothetical protein
MIQTLDLRQRVVYQDFGASYEKNFLKIHLLKTMEQIWVIFLHFRMVYPLKTAAHVPSTKFLRQ